MWLLAERRSWVWMACGDDGEGQASCELRVAFLHRRQQLPCIRSVEATEPNLAAELYTAPSEVNS